MLHDLPQRNDTPKSIFNPLKNDFVFEYLDDNNNPVQYKIPSKEIKEFPTYLADHAIKHLIEAIKNARGISSLTDEQLEELKKEIEVVI